MVTNASAPLGRDASVRRRADYRPDPVIVSAPLHDMTKAQLMELAKKRGLEVKPALRKADLIELLEEAGA